LNVVEDGVEALAFLRREGKYADAEPQDLVLLDLNLPRKDGREVLAEMKSDPDLRRVPVIVLTTSSAEVDIRAAYDLHANCYITKPVDLDHFITVVRSIEDFWLATVKLPRED
jgi:CheY-like chemotaxis protein